MGVYVIYTKLYIFAAYALHALLLVGVAHAFGTVSHVQQSVRRMPKCMMKEFQEVSEVSITSPKTIKDMVVSQDGHVLSLLH